MSEEAGSAPRAVTQVRGQLSPKVRRTRTGWKGRSGKSHRNGGGWDWGVGGLSRPTSVALLGPPVWGPAACPPGQPPSPWQPARQRGLLLPGQVPDLGRRGLLLLVRRGFHGGVMSESGSTVWSSLPGTCTAPTLGPSHLEFAHKSTSREI